MEFAKVDGFDSLEMAYVSNLSGGYISRNADIFSELDMTKLDRFVLERCVYGTPVFKLGEGGKKIMILSGIHGNELPPQIANLRLLGELAGSVLKNTLYFIPFAAPKSTMNNDRFFNFSDLNRSAHTKNSLSNAIVELAQSLGVDFVGDFHSTAFNSNPGIESVFSSKNPTPESFLIATYIARDVGCEVISYDSAGASYKGAVEDVCNLRGIPAVTCEVLSPFRKVAEGSVERSFAQMKSFLDYFGI